MIESIELFEIDGFLWALVEDDDGIGCDLIRMADIDDDGAEG